MTSFSRRAPKSWVAKWTLMAFFAIFALAASPSFAFGCCCHAAHAAASTTTRVAPIKVQIAAASPVTLSSCDNCENESEKEREAANHSASALAPAASMVHSTAANAAHPHLQGRCDCTSSDTSQLALTETALSFAPLIASAPPQVFALTCAFSASIRLAFASNAARPRSRGATHETGRAPPVSGI